MAKMELFQNPFIGFIIRHLGAFPVARGKGDTSAIDTAVETVKSGRVLGLFPEGTRSHDDRFFVLNPALQSLHLKAVVIFFLWQFGMRAKNFGPES